MRDWLSHRAATTPGATALIDVETEQRRSFADLDGRVDRIAGRLAALGVGAGDHVGTLLTDRAASVALLWASMRLGAVHVPLRPEWEPVQLARRGATADVDHLVCDAATEATVEVAMTARAEPLALGSVITIDEPETDATEPLSGTDPESIAPSTWTRSETATIAFTAGTTGEPRPVVLKMGNHLANATDTAFHLGTVPSDRWLSYHPVHHVSGLATAMRAVLFGSSLVVQLSPTPGGLADALDTHRVTCLVAPPKAVDEMLDARGMLADSLRAVVLTGAPPPPALLDRCQGYSIPALPAYSLTEAAGLVTAAAPHAVAGEPGSVGYPLLRTAITVVDTDGTPVGRGQTGEIVVAGPSVTPGYYDAENGGPTASDGHGIATGDVGYRDEDGRVHVLSRRADQIVVAGETVRAGDVRDVICNHEDVVDAAVVAIPDLEWGERPAALVVRSGAEPTLSAAGLETYCERRLADFVVPAQFAFTAALPRVPSGDVDRQAVRRQFLDGEDD